MVRLTANQEDNPLQNYLVHLGIDDYPNFENLDPKNDKDVHSFISRLGISVKETAHKIIALSKLSPDQVLLVSASPGVGKSTYIKFLASELGSKNYISLFDYSPAFEYNYNIDLTNQHILRFAAHLEDIFSLISDQKTQSSSGRLGQYSTPKFDTNFEIDDYIIDVLKKQSLKNGKKKHYVFIDNVDFLRELEQFRIIRIICSLSAHFKNVTFVVAGRPFVTMLARQKPREFFGTSTNLLHHLPYLGFRKVLLGRFNAVCSSEFELDKFLDEGAVAFLDKFIDGNIALGLKIVTAVFLARPFDIDDKKLKADWDFLLKVLLGRQLVPVSSDQSDNGDYGFVPNILAKVKNADRIPIVYFILRKLFEKTYITDSELQSWNEEILALDSQGVSHSPNEFRNLLDKLRGMRLIRRTGTRDNEALVRSLAMGNDFGKHFDCYYQISRTGVATIELAAYRQYLQMVKFSSFPTGYRRYFESDKISTIPPDESKPWD